jgi:hypothetical protein
MEASGRYLLHLADLSQQHFLWHKGYGRRHQALSRRDTRNNIQLAN